MKLDATPFAFPLQGDLDPKTLAFLAIDMQVDFVGATGFMAANGCDMAFLAEPIAPIAQLLAAARARGVLVVHTREAFLPDLSDAQPHRLFRSGPDSRVVGDVGPAGRALVRGEPCWDIVPELAPLPGEAVFDKPSYGAFGTTGIHAHLQAHGIRHLILAGVTTECCIHSNAREALDRGYEIAVVEDACAAATRATHDHAMALFKNSSGVFGTVTRTRAVLSALAAL
jgi:nicotinamidase-related amidase